MTPRDTTVLPGAEELAKILAAEAKRAFPPGKEDSHYVDFQPLVRLLAALNLPTELLTRDYAPEEVFGINLLGQAAGIIADMEAKLTTADAVPKTELDAAYDYLAEEDELAPADAIFVFGNKSLLRAEKAVALYQAGYAPLLIFSGHAPFTESRPDSEAEVFRQYALDQGVPAEAIIIETNSLTIPDNVRSSLNLLDERGIAFKSLILVNTPFVQRRGWSHYRKYLPDDVKLIRQNSATSAKFSRAEWFRTGEGIKVVANEYFKMKVGVSLNTA